MTALGNHVVAGGEGENSVGWSLYGRRRAIWNRALSTAVRGPMVDGTLGRVVLLLFRFRVVTVLVGLVPRDLDNAVVDSE